MKRGQRYTEESNLQNHSSTRTRVIMDDYTVSVFVGASRVKPYI